MTDWKRKLAAWLHDPAEKSLILLRDPAGHEWGTAKALREKLGIDYASFDQRADHLAAAADRPQWPRPDDRRYPAFEQVNFACKPELIHPLSGGRIDLAPLAADIGVAEIKAVSLDHFSRLVQGDARLTYLAFWRFGPEAGKWATDIGPLWQMMPADTRVPDHSIWSHVDTVAALQTALDGDEQGPDQPALLAMSFGPVQSFIGQARSTSDLWAGSHLLSTLVWEAIRSVVESLGPDAVLFPALRGVPVADRWLIETGGGAFRGLFEDIGAEILDERNRNDTNPLFAASLPNKFLAIVPSRQARSIAETALRAARTRARTLAEEAARRVFERAGVALNETTLRQIDEQLAEFPEGHWAAATWPVAREAKDVADVARDLRTALAAIHAELGAQGIFDARIWPILTRELKLGEFTFWSPNSGVLYPAVFDLAERSLAAAKATRPFRPVRQQGFRCSLTGEHEWLTDDRVQLFWSRAERKERQTVWTAVAAKQPSWAKPGEHLGAIATLKRLWPTLFAEEIGVFLGLPEDEKVRRFVVSTHALALSTSIDRLLDCYDAGTMEKLAAFSREHQLADEDPVALPVSLHARIREKTNGDRNAEFALKRLPALLDRLHDADGRPSVDGALRDLFGANNKPEAYYALIQMDGDRMGAWLAGNEDDYKLAYRQTWHSRVAHASESFAREHPQLRAYLEALRPSSPGRHAAISRALSDFSTHLARHVIEDCCKGKLLYSGGDDVLALVAVDDLFDAMQLLRLAYSGIAPDDDMRLSGRIARLGARGANGASRLLLAEGFGYLRDRRGKGGRLMTLMGHKATASMGAVVAHHTAPLSMVLRQLREAEARAKHQGRDRFCVRVLKRGGGEVSVVSPWWPVQDGLPQVGRSGLALMKRLAEELAGAEFSRGAIYRAQLWFQGMTDHAEDAADAVWQERMAEGLAAQFDRQSGNPRLAREVVSYVCEVMRPAAPRTAIEHSLSTAEFFSREARAVQRGGREKRRDVKEAA